MAPAGSERGYVALKLGRLLGNHVEEHKLGRVCAAETGFRISSNPDTVRAPDAAFVSRERSEKAGRVEGYWPGAPDLAAEVVLPNDTHTDVMEKALAWLDAGSHMVLVLDPVQHAVTVYRSLDVIRVLREDATVTGGGVVSGWRLPVADLFR